MNYGIPIEKKRFNHEVEEVRNQVVLSFYQHPGVLSLPPRFFMGVFVRKQTVESKSVEVDWNWRWVKLVDKQTTRERERGERERERERGSKSESVRLLL